ncbi:MAG TPA: polysaccharide (de)acetylase [Bacteroidetes bacterium]|nr:polysaccharide (de)acetylase [Bacteroidota bacterium]
MIANIKNSIRLNLKNIPGWRTSRKILVLECDDYGSTRMPSENAYERLSSAGLNIGSARYDRYETIETREDLEQMFEVLYEVRDQHNKPAVMTAVTSMTNPDFGKIRSSGFNAYFYEKFTDTLKRYYPESNVFEMWKQGMDAGIFVPELHGREHITVQLWMQKLREGDKDLLFAFDEGFVSLAVPGIHSIAKGFRAEFYFDSEDQKPFLVNSIKDSVILFWEIFGFSPRVFVPSNGIFNPEFDRVVAGAGVRFLNVNHSMPYCVNRGDLKYRHFITGQKGPEGLTYYTRNCAFEPTEASYNGIGFTMKQVEAAFRWGKPAIISTHRGNFAGGIDDSNRKYGLGELRKLLKAIVKKWPDVEFLSSGDALDFMQQSR